MSNQIQLRARVSYSYCERSRRQQTNLREKIVSTIFYFGILLLKNWLRLRRKFKLNMESCKPADEEELPTFSLGMEFLTPQKGRKEKENKEQTRSSSRFATLSESELGNILAERHSERTNQITNWSVGKFKGKYFYLKCFKDYFILFTVAMKTTVLV